MAAVCIYCIQYKRNKLPLTGRDKEDGLHTYNGMLISHKKERNWVIVETWMDLETVIQSEVSQKEKIKYHILMPICGI